MHMGKSSATGSFQILIGVVGSTLILAVGTLVLAMLLSDAELGLYGVAMIPSVTINFFRDLGVNAAMTQQIASLRAANREAEIHDVIVSGVVFEVASGAVLALVCFGLAGFLASALQRPAAATFISIMALSIFFGAILAAASAVFIGYERMKLNSFTTVFQAIIRTGLGPLLVILGYGVLGAVIGASVSVVATGVVGIVMVYFLFYRHLRKSKSGSINILKNIKSMLKYGIPLTVSNLVVGVLPQVFAFTMALNAGDIIMGNYYAASYFAVILTFISIPVSTALFPAFAKLKPKEEPELLQTVFASSVKYTSVLMVPATLLVMSLATPIVNTLFMTPTGPKFPVAPVFLVVSSIINLYAVVGNVSLGTLLTGVGETKQLMKQSMLSLAVGLPLAYFMVSYLGAIGGGYYAVIGGILGILVSNLPSMIWGLFWVWKQYRVKADFKISAKILSASALAAVVTYLFLGVFSAAAWLMLAVGFVLFVVVYLVSAPLIGAVNQADVNNFRAMFSGLGVVAKLLEIPLKLVEYTLKLRRR